jgi:iron complex outermembrane receptor protein
MQQACRKIALPLTPGITRDSRYVVGGTIDYDSGPLRAMLNVNYRRLRQSNWRPKVAVGSAIPRVPKADANYSQP